MTVDDIKTANKAAGGHFFDIETMRLFQSRILDKVYEGPGGVYFVTSELVGVRVYTVREFYPRSGGVVTLATAMKCLTLATAQRRAAAAAAFSMGWGNRKIPHPGNSTRF